MCLRRISSERNNTIIVFTILRLLLSQSILHYQFENLLAYLANKIFTFNFSDSLQKNFQLPCLSGLFFFVWVKNNFFIYTKSFTDILQYSCSKNFFKFTGKHVCRSLAACNFVKTETSAKVFCHLIHFCGFLPSSCLTVMWSVLFIFQNRERDSKKSSAHVLCAASSTPRAASLKIIQYI